MKIIVVGASGTIGSAVAAALGRRHEVVGVARSGQPSVDLVDVSSIEKLFATETDVDAVVCCAANVPLAALEALTEERTLRDLSSKVLGQIQLARIAGEHLRDGGSITLTSGTFVDHLPGSALGAMANAGLEAFVRTAAPDLTRGLRINVVSPGWVTETLRSLGMDDPAGIPAGVVAQAYVTAVEGELNGETLSPSAW